MSGTKLGGQRAAASNIKKYGPDFYRRIGSIGGSKPTSVPKGFAAMSPEQRRAAGAKGGRIGRRGKALR